MKQNTLMHSYSFIAQSHAPSITFIVSFNSSIVLFLAMSPPKIFYEATVSFSTREFIKEMPIKRVCSIKKSFDLSKNDFCIACIKPRHSWSLSWNLWANQNLDIKENQHKVHVYKFAQDDNGLDHEFNFFFSMNFIRKYKNV